MLVLAIGTLLLLHAAGFIADHFYGNARFLKLRALFDVGQEQNLPTLFSTLQLEFAGLLLLLAARISVRQRRPGTYYWAGLAALFAFLGADEFCEWHERLVEPMQRIFHATGVLSFAWAIPYSVFVLLFAAGYLCFWWRLPGATRLQFAIAGLVYVGGGIGAEMVGAKIFAEYGWQNTFYGISTLVEDGMETLGVAVFVHAVLGYLRDAALEPLPDDRRAGSGRREAA